jgi:hypothetical protein
LRYRWQCDGFILFRKISFFFAKSPNSTRKSNFFGFPNHEFNAFTSMQIESNMGSFFYPKQRSIREKIPLKLYLKALLKHKVTFIEKTYKVCDFVSHKLLEKAQFFKNFKSKN